jgi:hypothetical protein
VLGNNLSSNAFDVGWQSYTPHVHLHTYSPEIIKNFKGTKIFIAIGSTMLSRHLWCFLIKNIHKMHPQYTTFHYTDRQTLDCLYYACQEWYADQCATNLNEYDEIIKFEDTFDLEFMKNFYQRINNQYADDALIEAMQSSNRVNLEEIPYNHVANVCADIVNFEKLNNLIEEQRCWVLNSEGGFTDDGVCLRPNSLRDSIKSKLQLKFYKDALR